MNQRPKSTDTMADVLKMQNDYLKEKSDEEFKPAAQIIKSSGSSMTTQIDHINLLNHFYRVETVSFCETEEFEAIGRE